MEQPNTNSLLLNLLPAELIVSISIFISPIDRAVFSLTCRALRCILGKSDARGLSTAQYLRYLMRIARNLPDQWVCEACFKLHPISRDDTPLTPWKMTCPLRWDRWCREVYGRQSRLDDRYLSVDHRHVQLALKYARLCNPMYISYYTKLLAEYRDPEFHTHPQPYNRQNVLKVEYIATPKVVTDPCGNLRYMLRSIWCFRKDSMEVSLVTVGCVRLCPHLALLGDMGRMTVRELAHLHVVRSWIYLTGKETYLSACHFCATDCYVLVKKDHAMVFAWQDMGTKGSPGDKAWRLHAWDRRFGMPPPGGRLPLFGHIGSVRALYNRTDKLLQPKPALEADGSLRLTRRLTAP
ncbi:hypothetical protein F4814DRAFT_459198 [Daldinia grandis]|nr:hypothetical protein F4814DRAFT_459198 [Daldinia grandis]